MLVQGEEQQGWRVWLANVGEGSSCCLMEPGWRIVLCKLILRKYSHLGQAWQFHARSRCFCHWKEVSLPFRASGQDGHKKSFLLLWILLAYDAAIPKESKGFKHIKHQTTAPALHLRRGQLSSQWDPQGTAPLVHLEAFDLGSLLSRPTDSG